MNEVDQGGHDIGPSVLGDLGEDCGLVPHAY